MMNGLQQQQQQQQLLAPEPGVIIHMYKYIHTKYWQSLKTTGHNLFPRLYRVPHIVFRFLLSLVIGGRAVMCIKSGLSAFSTTMRGPP